MQNGDGPSTRISRCDWRARTSINHKEVLCKEANDQSCSMKPQFEKLCETTMRS